MPLYDFKCPTCGETLTINFKSYHEVLDTSVGCPKGHGEMERMISSSSFVVKGFSAKNGYSK